jgi:hypothetical protein
LSLYEIKHDNRCRSGKNHNKNPDRVQNAFSPGELPVINETLETPKWGSVHHTESILSAPEGNVKHKCTKNPMIFHTFRG